MWEHLDNPIHLQYISNLQNPFPQWKSTQEMKQSHDKMNNTNIVLGGVKTWLLISWLLFLNIPGRWEPLPLDITSSLFQRARGGATDMHWLQTTQRAHLKTVRCSIVRFTHCIWAHFLYFTQWVAWAIYSKHKLGIFVTLGIPVDLDGIVLPSASPVQQRLRHYSMPAAMDWP